MGCDTVSGARRKVLEGVPAVGFYAGGVRCPEDVPFPACLKACLEFMGEALGCRGMVVRSTSWQVRCGYAYLMGTTGAAFRLQWDGTAMDGSNVDLALLADDPMQPYHRAFESIGYTYELLLKDETGSNEAEFRRRIVEQIEEKGRPVLALGVVGPPECCIITGFDEGGDVLTGWSFFQNVPEYSQGLTTEPCGYFRKPGWYADTEGILLLGDKSERPAPSDVFRSALRAAARIGRTAEVGARAAGLAAYDAWAESLLRDDFFPTDDIETLRARHSAHNDAVNTVAEGRWYASQFMKDATRHLPAAMRDLLVAAASYETEHELMRKLWDLQGGNDVSEECVRRLADPQVRRQSASIVRESRDQYAQALTRIERAV